MSIINFYLLQAEGQQARLTFACRLTEKIFKAKQRLFIYTASQQETSYIDELLWTFRDISFIPHHLQNDESGNTTIEIGHEIPTKAPFDNLLNLSLQPADFSQQFSKTLEIVPSDDNWKQQARANYRHYQQQGFELQTHKI